MHAHKGYVRVCEFVLRKRKREYRKFEKARNAFSEGYRNGYALILIRNVLLHHAWQDNEVLLLWNSFRLILIMFLQMLLGSFMFYISFSRFPIQLPLDECSE